MGWLVFGQCAVEAFTIGTMPTLTFLVLIFSLLLFGRIAIDASRMPSMVAQIICFLLLDF
jgi:hypothetical protein